MLEFVAMRVLLMRQMQPGRNRWHGPGQGKYLAYLLLVVNRFGDLGLLASV